MNSILNILIEKYILYEHLKFLDLLLSELQGNR